MFGSNPFGKPATPVQPTAGSSLFGSPSAAGSSTNSTGLFGAAARPGGLLSSPAGSTFGMMQPNVGLQQQTSVVPGSSSVTFGGAGTAGGAGTGSIFGASGGFGATGSMGMSSSLGATGVGSIVGGSRPSFNPPISTESSTQAKGGAQQTVNTKHMVITAMKEYQAGSLEELRSEDYAAGRRGPQSVVGSAGGVGMFGASSVQPASAAAPAVGSLFGSGAGTGGLFGSGAGASNPGAAKPFGAATSAVPTFGSVASSTATQNVGGGGLFGFNAGASSTVGSTGTGAGGLFGASSAAGAAKPTGFAFGSTASQPTSVAAPVSGTTSLFGGAAAGGGLFGSSAANAAKPSPFSFGASTGVSTASATPAAGSAFGFGAPTGATGGGLFGGAANAAKPFAFGASTGTAPGTSTASGGSFFGAPAAAPNVSAAPGGGLFGGGGGAFGSTAPKPLFGATQPSTGLTQLGFGSVGGSAGGSAAPSSVGGAFGFNLQNTGQGVGGGGMLLGQTPFQSSLQSTVGQPGASLMQQPFQLNQPSLLGNTTGAGAAQMSIGLSANHDEALLQQARVQQQVLDLVQTLPYGTAHLSRQLSSSTSSAASSLNPIASFGPYSPVSAYNYYAASSSNSRYQNSQQQQQQQQYMLPVATQRALANATNFTPNFSMGVSPKPAGKGSPLARPIQVANRKQLFEGFEQSDSMIGHQHQQSVNSTSNGTDNGLFFLEKSNWKKLTLPSSVLRSSLDSASASAIAASATTKATASNAAAAAAAKSKSLNDSLGVASPVESGQQLPDSSSAI